MCSADIPASSEIGILGRVEFDSSENKLTVRSDWITFDNQGYYRVTVTMAGTREVDGVPISFNESQQIHIKAVYGVASTLSAPTGQSIEPLVEGVTNAGDITLILSDPVPSSSLGGSSTARLLRDHKGIKTSDQSADEQVIEISLTSKTDKDVEPVNVQWSTEDFDGQTAHLMMDLDALRDEGIDLTLYDNIEISFNDGEELLSSESGKHVEFGKKINWSLTAPFVDEKEVSLMLTLANFMIALMTLAALITFVLGLFKGSLVSMWMLVNTLQIVAHLPLVSVSLPANAHYFLINLLAVVRLHFDKISSSIDDMESMVSEFELLSDDDSTFTAYLR